MATKIMLVIENKDDQDFLEKVLVRLQYNVISMRNGVDLSEQLIDHFPDVVFASTLGRNARILNALGKIKQLRGKPKLVFVKMKNEKQTLTPVQKEILDGSIYTPIDPFKLIDLLAQTTDVNKIELRRRYNEMLSNERGIKNKDESSADEDEAEVGEKSSEELASPQYEDTDEHPTKDYGQTKVMGKKRNLGKSQVENESAEFYGTASGPEPAKASEGSTKVEFDETNSTEQVSTKKARVESLRSLIHDPERKKKYDQMAEKFKASGEDPRPMDVQKLRDKQKAQSEEVSEDPRVKEDRKHFLKTLFSVSPSSVNKKE